MSARGSRTEFLHTLTLALLVVRVLIASVPNVAGQTGRSQRPSRNRSQIARIVREIDARNIERSIRKLVSFGTRNTLSEQNNPKRGIGAARDWLFEEFSRKPRHNPAGA